ncbi:MAG: UDP-N-acetylmuramoyl-L-alanyl-D-glutamate--2,6-diaminopimelate ligase, partial [Flavobacteriaceae bacterium]|nr:UDP-N-acetylmuramoyl-L-alanyl-D-glutamate--2,6-diaminopimelate ligase [Flavobacteriaceae bacterium]
MKNLKDILYRVAVEAVYGSTDVTVNQLVFDSRKVAESDVFIATKGTLADGHSFIPQVETKGVKAIVCEELPKELNKQISYIQVNDSKEALAIMADNFYDNPSQKLKLVGITGTNGKTTIASLLYSLFTKAGYKAGLLSTVKVMVAEHEFPATHTTPDSL